jgi:hypothetical protein
LTAGARDGGIERMELDDDKIDDAVLALLRLTLHDEGSDTGLTKC